LKFLLLDGFGFHVIKLLVEEFLLVEPVLVSLVIMVYRLPTNRDDYSESSNRLEGMARHEGWEKY